MAEKGTASIDISANMETILDVIKDIESYPDRLDAFQRAEVLERDDSGRPHRAVFEVDARIKVVEYELEYAYTDNSVSWRSVAGNVREINGSYTVEDFGDTSRVTYEYSIDPGFPVPGFLMRQGVKIMVSTALDDLKGAAESR